MAQLDYRNVYQAAAEVPILSTPATQPIGTLLTNNPQKLISLTSEQQELEEQTAGLTSATLSGG